MSVVQVPRTRPEQVSNLLAEVKAHRRGPGLVSLQSADASALGAWGSACHRHVAASHFYPGEADWDTPEREVATGGHPLQIFPVRVCRVRCGMAENLTLETIACLKAAKRVNL